MTPTSVRAISPAVSTMLLIAIAAGSVAAAASYTHNSGSIAARNIEVTIDGLGFSKARADSNVWLFSMNLRYTGTIPATISGTVTGTSVDQTIAYDAAIDPGSKTVLSYVWTLEAIPGEKYTIVLVATGSDGSTKTYLNSVTAEG